MLTMKLLTSVSVALQWTTSESSDFEGQNKSLKTDLFRVGTDIFVGKMGNNLCPVLAVLQYMVRRGSTSGPFSKFIGGRPVTRTRLVQMFEWR